MQTLARTPRQIGEALRRQRKLAGLTQTNLARRAGLSQEMVSRIESGKSGTSLETACRLLAALDLEFSIGSRSQSANMADIF